MNVLALQFDQTRLMDGNKAILEYCASEVDGGSEAWGFRLKTSDGQTLIESAKAFDSRSKAEEGFVSMIKLIATNQYTVRASALPDAGG
jgi:hypothetical protein